MGEMRSIGSMVSFVIVLFALAGFFAQPSAPAAVGHATGHAPGAPASWHLPTAPAVARGAHGVTPSDTPLTFPRTVLVETFTGVWCIHCPAESQALYKIDESSSHDTIAIAELHVCALPTNCLEKYVPPDNTSSTRGAFYSVCGFPDVFIDGQHGARGYPNGLCGASDSEPQMENSYRDDIANASAVPGNVSISAVATLATGGVAVHTNITSGLTGSYSVVSYLLEFIGKRNQSNGYGPHDVGNVVRETIHNHPMSLTAGSTVHLDSMAALLPSWNTRNLSVITLVQNNSTRIVENSNYAPVTSLVTDVTSDVANLSSAGRANVTVSVTNTSTGAAVEGAAVALTSSAGATFTPSTGTTSALGTFTASYLAPHVSAVANDIVTAYVNATNYTAGVASTTIVVNPLVPPTVPLALAVTPAVGQICLNWTAPASGAGGVRYDLYDATDASGPFTLLAQTTAPSYADVGLTGGQTVWFKVAAFDVGGFSPNTTAVSATSVETLASGLPPLAGWWISDGTLNFTSALGDSAILALPAGDFEYAYGTTTYAVVPSPASSGSLVVTPTALTITLTFAPRLATLQGTVDPPDATVVFNGSGLPVFGGSFSTVAAPGTYTLNASSPGYTSQSVTVTLTPGNATPVHLVLVVAPAGPGGVTSAGGLSDSLTVGILAVVAVIAVAAVLGTVLMRSRRGGPRSPPKAPKNGA